MLNKYPLWKYLLIAAILTISFIYSAPNLFPDDPAIQVTGASSALPIEQADLDRATTALKAAGIENFIHVRCNVLETLKEYNAKLLK